MNFPTLNNLLPFALFSTTLLLVDNVRAAAVHSTEAETNTTQLSPVESHGNRTAQLSPLDLPGSHSRIDLSDDIAGDHQLEDILQQQAGIQVRQLGGRGQFSYPSIRGANGKQLQIVWDGIPLTTLNNSEGELPSVGLSALGSIDIYRGVAPAELAPTAIGGTIHLRSKDHFDTPASGHAYTSAGSYGYYSAGLWQQYQNDVWRFFAAADWMKAENDFDTRTDINAFNNPNESSTEKRLNNGADHRMALLRADYTDSTRVKPSLVYQYQKKRRELPGLRNIPQNDAYFASEDNRLSLRLNIPYSHQQQTDIITSVYTLDETYDDQGDNIGLGRQKNYYRTKGTDLRVNHHSDAGNISNLLTLSVRSETTESDFALVSDATIELNCLTDSGCPYDYQRRQYQLGDRLSGHINDAIMLNGQLSVVKFSDTQQNHYGISDQHNNERFTTGDAGVNFRLNDNNQLDVLISRQVRPVSTQELFGDRGLTEGNPDLKSETSKGIDAVWRMTSVYGEYSLSAYQRVRDNAIVASADSRGVIKYQNLAQTNHRGVELNLSIDLTHNLTLNGNSGWHRHTIAEHSRDFFVGKRVPNQRTWDNYYSLTYRYGNTGTSLAWLLQTGGFYETSNRLPIDDKNQIDWNIFYQLQNFRLQLNAFNLTDNQVSDFYDYPVPGRNYSIKLDYSW